MFKYRFCFEGVHKSGKEVYVEGNKSRKRFKKREALKMASDLQRGIDEGMQKDESTTLSMAHSTIRLKDFSVTRVFYKRYLF